jgi:hypothetical protein
VDAGDREVDPFTYAVHAFKSLLLKEHRHGRDLPTSSI